MWPGTTSHVQVRAACAIAVLGGAARVRCTIKMQILSANQKSTTEELQSTPPPSRAQRADLPWQLAPRSEFMLNM